MQINFKADNFNFLNGKLLVEYYQEYYKSSFKDFSFFVYVNNCVVGHVSCCLIDNKLSWINKGIIIKFFDNDINIEKTIYNKVVNYIHEIAKNNHINWIEVSDKLYKINNVSWLGEVLINCGYKPELTFDMVVCLSSFNASNYFKIIRNSYKSLVNWGKKNLNIFYVNKQNQRLDLFNQFKNFHKVISGKTTRSDKTWDIQYEILCEGFGELTLGFLENNLVAGSLFIDQSYTTIYFSGVYERLLFKYGISHYLLYDGVCRSHERGNTNAFYLGNFDISISDQKLYNIQFFKKGFCQFLTPVFNWKKVV
jgi:hypothetical protein